LISKKGKNKIFEGIVKIIPDKVKISSIRQADALGLDKGYYRMYLEN
jgi:UTP-glucose-1-phosphate uridylyltransferase